MSTLPAITSNAYADRRPIGSVFISEIVKGIDLTTIAGKYKAQQTLLASFQTMATRLTKANAQGLIVWSEDEDTLGIGLYGGEPQIMELIDWLNEIIDPCVACITGSGLRIGFCVRHGQLVRNILGQIVRVTGNGVYDALAKATYVKQRFGATYVYEDTNTDEPGMTGNGVNTMAVLPAGLAGVFLANGILPIFEQTTPDYAGHGFGYADCQNGAVPTNNPSLPQLIAHAGMIDAAHHAELVALCKAGNPFLIQAWWENPENAVVAKIYRDAGVAGF